MSNIVELSSQKLSKNEVGAEDSTHKFILDNLIPWAEAHSIDIESKLFKLNASTIMSCLQGMLVSV